MAGFFWTNVRTFILLETSKRQMNAPLVFLRLLYKFNKPLEFFLRLPYEFNIPSESLSSFDTNLDHQENP